MHTRLRPLYTGGTSAGSAAAGAYATSVFVRAGRRLYVHDGTSAGDLRCIRRGAEEAGCGNDDADWQRTASAIGRPRRHYATAEHWPEHLLRGALYLRRVDSFAPLPPQATDAFVASLQDFDLSGREVGVHYCLALVRRGRCAMHEGKQCFTVDKWIVQEERMEEAHAPYQYHARLVVAPLRTPPSAGGPAFASAFCTLHGIDIQLHSGDTLLPVGDRATFVSYDDGWTLGGMCASDTALLLLFASNDGDPESWSPGSGWLDPSVLCVVRIKAGGLADEYELWPIARSPLGRSPPACNSWCVAAGGDTLLLCHWWPGALDAGDDEGNGNGGGPTWQMWTVDLGPLRADNTCYGAGGELRWSHAGCTPIDYTAAPSGRPPSPNSQHRVHMNATVSPLGRAALYANDGLTERLYTFWPAVPPLSRLAAHVIVDAGMGPLVDVPKRLEHLVR